MIQKLFVFPVLLLPLAFSPTTTLAQEAANQSQLDSVSEMGNLNGTALQCSYVEQMQRIKQALVLNLPKQRALGDWFENSTNASFLNFMKSGNGCGSKAIFTLQVDDAIVELENVFKK